MPPLHLNFNGDTLISVQNQAGWVLTGKLCSFKFAAATGMANIEAERRKKMAFTGNIHHVS